MPTEYLYDHAFNSKKNDRFFFLTSLEILFFIRMFGTAETIMLHERNE